MHSSRFWLFGLTVLSALILLQSSIENNNRSVIETRWESPQPPTTFYRFSPEGASEQSPVAILLHGFRCSANMMFPLARTLARNGLVAYTFDLPGHGHSTQSLPVTCEDHRSPQCQPSIDDLSLAEPFLFDLLQKEALQKRKLVLIGHSWGGIIAQKLVSSPRLKDYDLRFINLDGNVVPGIETLHPSLSIYRNRPIPHIPETQQVVRDFSHIGVIYNAKANRKILNWLEAQWDYPLGHRSAPGIFRYLVISAGIVVLAFWAIFLIPIRGETVRRPSRVPPKILKMAILVALATGLLVNFFRDSPWIRFLTEIRSLIYFYEMSVGVLGLLLLAMIHRSTDLKISFAHPLKTLSTAGLGALLFLPILSFYIDRSYFHAMLSPHRLGAFVIYSLGFFPICLLSRRLIWSQNLKAVFCFKLSFWCALELPHNRCYPNRSKKIPS